MRGRFVLGIVADATALVVLRPDEAALHRDLVAPHAWVATAGADAAAAQLAGALVWLVAAWLAIGLLACIGGALPGAAGRLAAVLARVVLPRMLFRLAAGAAGLGILAAPALASAQSPGAAPVSAAVSAHAPVPVWPTGSAPAPTWPTNPPAHSPHRVDTRPPQRAATQRAATPHRPDAISPARPPSRHVIVASGDTLWSIAAAHLPAGAGTARIAATWPHWYAANRAAIGPDPGRIVPGQHLRVPELPEESR